MKDFNLEKLIASAAYYNRRELKEKNLRYFTPVSAIPLLVNGVTERLLLRYDLSTGTFFASSDATYALTHQIPFEEPVTCEDDGAAWEYEKNETFAVDFTPLFYKEVVKYEKKRR